MPQRNSLTHLLKQSPAKELTGLLGGDTPEYVSPEQAETSFPISVEATDRARVLCGKQGAVVLETSKIWRIVGSADALVAGGHGGTFRVSELLASSAT